MPTSAVDNSNYWKTPSGDSSSGTTSKKGSSNISDFNSFMKILASQLKNQDPTNPVSNTEFVSQLAQVQSLSQLNNISNTITATSAYNLIGKLITYRTTNSATGAVKTSTGTVQAVVTKDNTAYIAVNGEIVKVSAVQKVTLAAK